MIWKPEEINMLIGTTIPKRHCLKLLRQDTETLDSMIGRLDYVTSVRDLILIQNIFATHGLAPRVYKTWELIHKGKKRYALEVDYLGKYDPKFKIGGVKDRVAGLCELYHIKPYEQDLGEPFNYVGGKFVDFHGWKIDRKKYKKDLIRRINDITHFGKSMNGVRVAYQGTEDFNGKRKTEDRLRKLGKIDFKGKTVLDIGCNLGVFCIEAMKGGAKSVRGWDKPEVIQLAKEWANLNEHWEIRYYGTDITTVGCCSVVFDIVFFLAMEDYLGIPKWLHDSVGDVMYFEGHDYSDNAKLRAELEKHYTIEDLGFTDDRGKRMLLKCTNDKRKA